MSEFTQSVITLKKDSFDELFSKLGCCDRFCEEKMLTEGWQHLVLYTPMRRKVIIIQRQESEE